MAQLVLTVILLFVVYYIGYAVGRKEIVDEIKDVIKDRPCERCEHYRIKDGVYSCDSSVCQYMAKRRGVNERHRI